MQQANHLSNLYLLVQVVDAGGLSAAARQLGLTRSMVSRRLLALERELGVRLLDRDARYFAVTQTGEQVYRHALIMCDAAQAASLAARDARGMDGVQIRLGMEDALMPLAGALLSAFCEQHPAIRLIVCGVDDATTLTKRQVDVVFSVGKASSVEADIEAQVFASLRWIVVASPDLLERLDHPRHPDQLGDQDCLYYGTNDWNLRGTPTRRRQPRLVSSHLPTVLAMARAGLGFVQVPMHACHADLISGRLCPAFEAFEARPLPMRALTLSNQAVGVATLDFITFARRHFIGMDACGIIAAC